MSWIKSTEGVKKLAIKTIGKLNIADYYLSPA